MKLEENYNALNEKNKKLVDENIKMKEDNLNFKQDILKLKTDMNLLQIQNSRYEKHINLLLSGIDKITTFIDESSIKADEIDNNSNNNNAIKKSVSLTKSNSQSQNLNFHNNLVNMYQSFDNSALRQNNQSLTPQKKYISQNEPDQNLSSFSEEQLYRTEEDRVIFRNGILYGIIQKYSEIEKVVGKIQKILQKGARFKIVYKASEVGDRAMTFHQHCDNIDISLVLIETTKGVRFGGFTTKTWEGNCQQKFDNDAFVFSIDKNKIYEIIKNEIDTKIEYKTTDNSSVNIYILNQIDEIFVYSLIMDVAINIKSKKEDKELSSTKIFELSKDQKPELPEEKKRIYKMGGIVDQMLDSKGKRNGPFRVWAGTNNYPGLAMSRCIGDLKGKKCGLISEPEIIEYNLDERSKYMVIASDGVWEFIDNEDVMRMGIDFYVKDNIEEFLEKIIKVSEFWWEKEDIIRDDITAVIVFF